jgi:hypothetical protein
MAGPLLPRTKRLIQATLRNEEGQAANNDAEIERLLINTICQCLTSADQLTDVKTVAVTPISTKTVRLDQWTLAHRPIMAKAVCKFDKQTQTSSGQLKCIQFVNLHVCITDADVRVMCCFATSFVTGSTGNDGRDT